MELSATPATEDWSLPFDIDHNNLICVVNHFSVISSRSNWSSGQDEWKKLVVDGLAGDRWQLSIMSVSQSWIVEQMERVLMSQCLAYFVC